MGEHYSRSPSQTRPSPGPSTGPFLCSSCATSVKLEELQYRARILLPGLWAFIVGTTREYTKANVSCKGTPYAATTVEYSTGNEEEVSMRSFHVRFVCYLTCPQTALLTVFASTIFHARKTAGDHTLQNRVSRLGGISGTEYIY